jgi:hypothetical protein
VSVRIYATARTRHLWNVEEACQLFSDSVFVQDSLDRSRIREEQRLARVSEQEESK